MPAYDNSERDEDEKTYTQEDADRAAAARVRPLSVDNYWHPALTSDSICYELSAEYIDHLGFIKKGNISFEMLPFNLETTGDVEYDMVLSDGAKNMAADILEGYEEASDSGSSDTSGNLYQPTVKLVLEAGDFDAAKAADSPHAVAAATAADKALEYTGTTSTSSGPSLTDEEMANITGLAPGAMTLFADFISADSKYTESWGEAPSEPSGGGGMSMQTSTSTGGQMSPETIDDLSTIGETVLWVPFQNMDAKYPMVFAKAENLTDWFNQIVYEYADEEAIALYDKYSGLSPDTSVYQEILDLTVAGASEIAHTMNSKKFSRQKSLRRAHLKTKDFVNLGDREQVANTDMEAASSKEIIAADDLQNAAIVSNQSMTRTNY